MAIQDLDSRPAQIRPVPGRRRARWRRVYEQVQTMLRDTHLAQLIVAPLATIGLVFSFFASLSNSAHFMFWATTFVLAGTWMVATYLALALRHNRNAVDASKDVIRGLVNLLIEQQVPAAYTWESWDEEIRVSRGGDVLAQQWRVLRATGQDVGVAWAAVEQTPFGDMSDHDKQAVRVSAFSYTVDENGRRVWGVPLPMTTIWREDADAFFVCLGFQTPLPAGQARMIVFTWEWPGFYRRLLNGRPDDVSFTRKRGSVQHVTQRITFDASCKVPADIGIDPIGVSPAPRVIRHKDGSVTLVATYGDDIPDRAGYTLHIARP